jgi:peptide-methionine (S)-S-oxide reductase
MSRAFVLAALIASAGPASAAPKLDTAVLAGGCFWGMEAVFEHVAGVHNVVSGYAGGSARDANYRAVTGERTGHAEAIRITYDPARISYGQLLSIYVTVAHDPTQLNRQGPDKGPSYRSAIFPQTEGQRRAASAFLGHLRASGAYKKPVVTRIEKGAFYAAEAEHQDFVRRNPWHPYVLMHDKPKLAQLKAKFPRMWRG